MSFEHPYPDHAYLEVDPETNEKRWFGTKGMGVEYVHEDRAAKDAEVAVKAEREACASKAREFAAHYDEGRAMTQSLAEALPEAIAKVSEHIGKMEAQAKEYDAMHPGMGQGVRLIAAGMRVHRDAALAAQQSGDVIAMIAAYQGIKPALDLATAEAERGPGHDVVEHGNTDRGVRSCH